MKISVEKRPYIKNSIGCAAIALTALTITSLGVNSCTGELDNYYEHKAFEKNKDKKYEISYGNVNVSGSNFEYYNIKNLKVFKTTNGEYKIVIKDSNYNYYFIDEGLWYQTYIYRDYKFTLINENNEVVSGMFDNINYYLEGKNTWTIEELINEQNNLNGQLVKKIVIGQDN